MTDTHDNPEGGEPVTVPVNSSDDSAENAAEEASRARRGLASARRTRRFLRSQQWREEFPYHWRADDLVTRRDTLRFLVAGSGALFIATTALAGVGALRSTSNMPSVRVAGVNELAENEWRVFNYPDQYAQGIIVRLPGSAEPIAYSDVCTHLSCAVLYQAAERPEDCKFHCPCHEGWFDARSGNVLAGPPTRPLPRIELRKEGDSWYAVREVER